MKVRLRSPFKQQQQTATMAAVAPHPSAPAPGDLSQIKPQPAYAANPTLYLSNIDWSIKKPLLKRALFCLFTRHGKVLDVIILRGHSKSKRPLRGQAWVIYESVASATAAMAAEQHFVFFGRPLVINYAKETSDRIAKRDGTFKKRKVVSDDGLNDKSKVVKMEESKVPAAAASAPSGPQPSDSPTSTLLAAKIPSECNEMMLSMLFKQYSGFQRVNSHQGGMYTIVFNSERDATAALNGLNGFKLNASSVLDLTYCTASNN